MPQTIADGNWALLLLSGGERRLVRVKCGSKTQAGKQQCLMDPIVGAPFGSNFCVQGGKLVRDARTVEDISGEIDAFADESVQTGASNADLFDDGQAQKLTDADIQRLKRDGTQGAELVKAIAANSATFAGKTAFAQNKYLRKKARKHLHYVTVLQPTPLTVCDMYMHKGPEKLMQLRRDTLAQVMCLSNAQPGSRVLVLESTLGLFAAAATQRIGGDGRVLSVSAGKSCLDCVGYLNMPTAWTSALRTCALSELLSLPPMPPPPMLQSSQDLPAATTTTTTAESLTSIGSGQMEQSDDVGAAAPTADKRKRAADVADEEGGGSGASKVSRTDDASSITVAEAAETVAEAAETVAEAAGSSTTAEDATGGGKKNHGGALRGEALEEDARSGYTSLIVATRESVLPAIIELLARLVPGSPFAIYHASMQPLVDCMHACQQAKAAVKMQLLESWARPYQVAPGRTHPEMNAFPPTGYILCGVAVLPRP
jgi:tRNA (adenine-N(1)-)-methyltransferase non-catalytic subunit